MQSAIIGTVHGDFEDIPTNVFPVNHRDSAEEYQSSVNVDPPHTKSNGERVFTGNAAQQHRVDFEDYSIDDDGTISKESNQSLTRTTNVSFLSAPGEFVAVESSKGEYAFDLIGRATETAIERISVDLDSFVHDHEGAHYWMSGFSDRSGPAESGVAYGDDVLEDPSIGETLIDANINQIGVSYTYKSNELKMQLTESGYVRVYEPNDLGPITMSRIIQEEVLPYEVS